MKVLLVYPRYPDTFWSFKHALGFISKKAAYPPLGLLTVAAMLPHEWPKRVVDMNVKALKDEDIRWADYVFISAMSIQKESVEDVIRRCNRLNVKVVAGGPLFTTGHDQFKGVDHFVLGEAEAILPAFLKDLEMGNARPTYTSSEWSDIVKSPIPRWELVDMKHYALMSVQYSRGCPYDCEFCDIVVLNGHRPRTKDKDQLLAELDAIYRQGWRGGIFVVDDNFIGNKRKVRAEILPALKGWMEERGHPFTFSTQVSINLASDEELMRLMVEVGFNTVFIGIETPNDDSLMECGKQHNRNLDLLASVKKIQNYGMQVYGGFIVGFDNDPPSIFEKQISFIQKSGIVAAMVGLLNAPRGTKLYQRLKKENRLVEEISGDITSTNFIPKMKAETLLNGYHQVISTIYSPKQYYERIKAFLREYRPRQKRVRFPSYTLPALIKLVWTLGIRQPGRRYFWKLLFSTMFRHPYFLGVSMVLAGYGFHFRKMVDAYNRTRVAVPRQIDPL